MGVEGVDDFVGGGVAEVGVDGAGEVRPCVGPGGREDVGGDGIAADAHGAAFVTEEDAATAGLDDGAIGQAGGDDGAGARDHDGIAVGGCGYGGVEIGAGFDVGGRNDLAEITDGGFAILGGEEACEAGTDGFGEGRAFEGGAEAGNHNVGGLGGEIGGAAFAFEDDAPVEVGRTGTDRGATTVESNCVRLCCAHGN